MGQLTPILTKNYKAGAIIYPKRIVKFGADDKTVILATGSTDSFIGVVDNVGYDTANTNNRYPNPDVNIYIAGVAPLIYGGTITRGSLITSDANGKGIAATAIAGLRIIGIALEDGVAGDEGTVYITQGVNSLAAPGLGFTTISTIATAAAVTYTAAQLFNGLILRNTNGANRADITPTAALLVAASFAAGGCCRNRWWRMRGTQDSRAARQERHGHDRLPHRLRKRHAPALRFSGRGADRRADE